MDNEEQINGQEGQQQEQKQQPSAAGQGINSAFRLGRGLFKLGRLGLNKRRKAAAQQPGEEALEAAEAVGKKLVGSVLKRYSLFAFGISFFWFLIIFSVIFFILTIFFPSGGVIPDDAKALMPTVAPTATPRPFFNPGGGSTPGTGGGGGSTPPVNAPPPGPASSSISETANNLVQILQSGCGGQVNSGNYTCAQAVYNGGILFPDVAYDEIITSAINYEFLQCVGFVNATVAGATGVLFPRVGNARDYARDIPGFTFIPVGGTIAVGDIVVWDDGGFGHIAVVVQVYDQNNIQTAEGNFDYHGGVALRNRVISSEPNLKGWLRKS